MISEGVIAIDTVPQETCRLSVIEMQVVMYCDDSGHSAGETRGWIIEELRQLISTQGSARRDPSRGLSAWPVGVSLE